MDKSIDHDPSEPFKIEHNCEQIFADGKLEMEYNYLVYSFRTDQHLITAWAYLDDIERVQIRSICALTDPFTPLEDVHLDPDVRSYLERRYDTVDS
ncbi:MAG: hypothetical protein AAGJ32_05675 [Pseudomonadota bacterium]